jgi:hypothetical protein
METQHTYLVFQATCQRSYPTYEEWKPKSTHTQRVCMRSSYPTYEEWKPKSTHTQRVCMRSSYPTYEE